MNMILIITNFILLSIVVFLKMKESKIFIQFKMLSSIENDYKELLEKYIVQNAKVAELNAKLEQEMLFHQNSLDLFSNLEKDLILKFKVISTEIISKSNNDFLNLTNNNIEHREKNMLNMLNPIKEMLANFDTKINTLENNRVGAYESLAQQIKILSESNKDLKAETVSLSGALRSPNARGQWGEVQLRKLLELSGMLLHVDFHEQVTIQSEKNGEIIRPDVIINLPNDKKIIIDVKTPYVDYTQYANESRPDVQEKYLKDFLKKVKDHINNLDKKRYQEQISETADFVIMFMPVESMFSIVLRSEPNIMEFAIGKGVVIATPSTLLAMLNIMALIWRQDNAVKNINEIVKLGKLICERINLIENALGKIEKGIRDSSIAYKDAVLILERDLFAESKKFNEIVSNTKN